jgi:hypothetical protein
MQVSSSETKKILSSGDSQALCQLYPLSEHQPPRSGCSCGTKRRSVFLLLLVSIVLLRGRRSRRDRSPGGRIRCRRRK